VKVVDAEKQANEPLDPSNIASELRGGRIERANSALVADEEFADEQINLRTQTADRLVFRKYPWAVWIAGLLFIISGAYLILHLTVGDKYGKFFPHADKMNNQGNKWWQYVFTAIIIVIGFSFVYAGKVTTVTIDKYLNLVENRRTSVICRKKSVQRELNEITNIVSYKKGHEGINHYTLHYTIRAEFKHHVPMLILESASRSKIIKQVRKKLRCSCFCF
jgi:hypothetical protein